MRLVILAVGRARRSPEMDILRDYAKRLGGTARQVGLGPLDLKEVEGARGLGGPALMAAEADLLLAAAGDNPLIALDERGEDVDSEGFAALVGRLRDNGARTGIFVIGGADGLDQRVRDRAEATIRFGRTTWPHMLVRAMLAEQLYRAATILMGHPYHRGG